MSNNTLLFSEVLGQLLMILAFFGRHYFKLPFMTPLFLAGVGILLFAGYILFLRKIGNL